MSPKYELLLSTRLEFEVCSPLGKTLTGSQRLIVYAKFVKKIKDSSDPAKFFGVDTKLAEIKATLVPKHNQ